MIRFIRQLGSRGDTIVEVMLAVAIIGSVMAAGFAVTNKNIRSTQDTEEQVIAVKLVQQQIELLGSYPFDPTINSCYDPAAVGAQLSTASNDCKNITTGASGATYDIRITLKPGSVDIYKVSATWAGLSDSTKNVTMYYLKAD